MTADQEAMRALSDARLRRNYDLTIAQIAIAYERRLTEALETLQRNERAYLDEKVRRGIR